MLDRSAHARMREACLRHLLAILPLPNLTGSGHANEVVRYALEHLRTMGRSVTVDGAMNLIAAGTSDRAVVAHTDSVGVGRDGTVFTGRQVVGFDSSGTQIVNRTGMRPMGADDKVGVAIALSIAEALPEVHVWLTADEEVDLVGANALEADPVFLAVQCDRMGGVDVCIQCDEVRLADDVYVQDAIALLPHREPVMGGSTDVEALKRRGLVDCAFNLACGFYLHHLVEEYIVVDEVMTALADTHTLLTRLHRSGIAPPPADPSQGVLFG